MSNIYIPQKNDFMPPKRNYLMRAGFRGYNFGIDVKMRKIINDIYLLGIELCSPVLFYVTLNSEEFNLIKIPESFAGIKSITVFASTLGRKIDEKISELSDSSRILEASLLDSWASESLEFLNEIFDSEIRGKRKGTIRFSPGYGDLDITENIGIINILDQSEISVSGKTGLLSPRKSTVCMIGWYEQEDK